MEDLNSCLFDQDVINLISSTSNKRFRQSCQFLLFLFFANTLLPLFFVLFLRFLRENVSLIWRGSLFIYFGVVVIVSPQLKCILPLPVDVTSLGVPSSILCSMIKNKNIFISKQTHRQIDGRPHRQRNGQTDRETERQQNKRKDRQMDRQIDRQIANGKQRKFRNKQFTSSGN